MARKITAVSQSGEILVIRRSAGSLEQSLFKSLATCAFAAHQNPARGIPRRFVKHLADALCIAASSRSAPAKRTQ